MKALGMDFFNREWTPKNANAGGVNVERAGSAGRGARDGNFL